MTMGGMLALLLVLTGRMFFLQVVFGKKVVLEPSAQEQQDLETAETLEKAVVQRDDASSFTFWVTSLPQQPDAAVSADLC